MVVLIAEDSILFRERLVKSLLQCNPELAILEASTGNVAIKIASETTIDCAILDIALPDISGMKVLNFIKLHRSDAKTIMFTNYPTAEFKDICLNSGADYFFEKCRNFNEVLNLVTELANASKSAQK